MANVATAAMCGEMSKSLPRITVLVRADCCQLLPFPAIVMAIL